MTNYHFGILGKKTEILKILDFSDFFSAGIYLAKQWVLDPGTSSSRGKNEHLIVEKRIKLVFSTMTMNTG